MRFFDASALVKRYVREEGSTLVRRLLAREDVAVSRLSDVEVVSAFARLTREQAMSAAQRDRAVSAFTTDLAAWTVVEMTTEITRAARRLLLRHTLRAGDAIQLGSALVLQESVGSLDSFVAYDARLLEAAQTEGLRVG